MESSDFYFHSNRAKPLFYVKEIPVYLATLLTVLQVVFLIVGAFVGVVKWAEFAAFSSTHVLGGEVWRICTYVLVNTISLGFLLGTVMLFIIGKQLEEIFGRKGFGVLYLLGVLIPPAVAILAAVLTRTPVIMAGPNIVHFCLFLGLAFFQPNAFMFVCWLKMKWLATAFFALVILAMIQSNAYVELAGFLAACTATYIWLRKCGLSPRFEKLEEALKSTRPQPEAKPRLKTVEGRKSSKKNPKQYYEPKIRPRAEIDREHPAVVEIDALLEKISRHGVGSLTEEEKKALDKASAELKDKDNRR